MCNTSFLVKVDRIYEWKRVGLKLFFTGEWALINPRFEIIWGYLCYTLERVYYTTNI